MARSQPGRRQRSSARLLGLAALLAALGLLGSSAHAQRVRVHVQDQSIYAGLPFVLAVSARDFDPEPQPEISTLEIPGCEVTFLGVSPNVSTSISIINGRRSESRQVEFVYRYRVEARAPGAYRVPAITVSQGNKRASTQPASFRAIDVETTTDMRLAIGLPERPVWVGETFDVTIDWYLRRDPGQPSFSIPLFDKTAWIDVHPPQLADGGQRRQSLVFPIGDQEIELPYTRDAATVDGIEYTRFRFIVPVTPIQAGKLAVEPATVAAELQIGMGRDAFGFAAPRTKLFKATDQPRTLEVRPLPLKDKPPSFANAVGTAFSIQVQASRTVVQVGDPVELQILVRGNGRMEGLSLPELTNPQGLPAEQFAVAESPATGEITEDGKGKLFRVTARLKSAEAREIPRLGFSYFDPDRGTYQTIYSEPIALSVQGSSMVGAGDVVSAVKQPDRASTGTGTGAASPGAAGAAAGIASFVGADLSLSSDATTLDTGWTLDGFAPFLIALYALPLLILVVRLWQVATRDRRDQSSEVRQALRAVHHEIAQAETLPAREATPRILAALRTLARITGQRASGNVIERLETESFSPAAASKPLDAALRTEAKDLAESWARESRGKARAASTASAAVLLLGMGFSGLLGLWATPAHAAPSLDEARSAYRDALAQQDRDARTAAFARAETLFRAQVSEHPDRPELVTDWGNAALGAQDLGRATLAYRRALALDPGLSRAERNLSWVRNRAPEWLPVPDTQRAGDSLFFWHHALSRSAHHLIAAVAFAAAVLLLAPWGGRHARLLRRLAVIPAVIWVAMIGSVLAQGKPADDAVVLTDGVALLSADSPGAPPALARPLPAGAEVSILETRDLWTRVALADGTKGWLQSGALERVRPSR